MKTFSIPFLRRSRRILSKSTPWVQKIEKKSLKQALYNGCKYYWILFAGELVLAIAESNASTKFEENKSEMAS